MLYTVLLLQTLLDIWTMYIYFTYIYIQYVHLISVALLQNDQFVCFAECKYVAYLLNQHRQLTK